MIRYIFIYIGKYFFNYILKIALIGRFLKILDIELKLLKLILSFLYKFNLTSKLLKLIDKVGIKKKLVSGANFRRILEQCQSGDIILIRAYGELTTLVQQIVGSTYTHAAIVYHDKINIIDATGKGVTTRDILELQVGVSKICIRRPILQTDEVQKMVNVAKEFEELGVKYDYKFQSSKEEMYCSELVFHCINKVKPNTLELRKRFGIMTITPDDIYKADKVFKTIVEI